MYSFLQSHKLDTDIVYIGHAFNFLEMIGSIFLNSDFRPGSVLREQSLLKNK